MVEFKAKFVKGGIAQIQYEDDITPSESLKAKLQYFYLPYN